MGDLNDHRFEGKYVQSGSWSIDDPADVARAISILCREQQAWMRPDGKVCLAELARRFARSPGVVTAAIVRHHRR